MRCVLRCVGKSRSFERDFCLLFELLFVQQPAALAVIFHVSRFFGSLLTASSLGSILMWIYFSVVEYRAWRMIFCMMLGGMFSRASVVAAVWRQEYGGRRRHPARSKTSY